MSKFHIFAYKYDIKPIKSDMKNNETSIKDELHYLTITGNDEKWGIVVTTVGYQFIPPRSQYPLSEHPDKYRLTPKQGRVLNEYQLIYITKGSGYFISDSCPQQHINAGTMILLFPGEWHNYHPDNETGWNEYWVGFRGEHIDKRVNNRFFNKEEPVHRIGVSAGIISLHEELLNIASQEKLGHQQMASSIVLHILGSMYYKEKNNSLTNTFYIDKVNEAKLLMKDFSRTFTIEELASQIGIGYSKFRKLFKEHTGIAPAQYHLQQRLLKAKELLGWKPKYDLDDMLKSDYEFRKQLKK